MSPDVRFILIALAVILFPALYLVVTRRIIAGTRFIRALGIMVLLIVFQLVNLLVYPLLQRVPDTYSMFIPFVLVAVAMLFTALHHIVEKWTISKIMEKNKKIRLSAARQNILHPEKN
jgi:hypothetical protein